MSRNSLIFLPLALLALAGCGKNDPPEPKRPARTVIVYMAASNNLETYALANINQMEKAVTADGQVLVYLDVRGEAPRVLKITRDTSPEIVSPAVISYTAHNSASASVLKQVLEDIREAYPSDAYGLIMWSHASSWMPPGTFPVTESFGDDGGEQMDSRDQIGRAHV